MLEFRKFLYIPFVEREGELPESREFLKIPVVEREGESQKFREFLKKLGVY